jgi:phytanoyl-CoA hydroxylase
MSMTNVLQAPTLDQLTLGQACCFSEEGYVVLERHFDSDQIARFKAHIDELWEARAGCPLVIDGYEDYLGGSKAERTFFAHAHDGMRNFPYKLNDTHLIDPLIREFALDPRLVASLTQLLGSTPLVCNTLLFERSSQQTAHFDTFYMPSPTPNKMAAAWIAFDPVTDTNGPLVYYPKSHLIKPFRFSNGGITALEGEAADAERCIARIISEHGLEKVEFYPRPGDVLIWHAQLLHGGGSILNMHETRTSLVTHYWTALDYPDPAQHIVVGPGRLMLKKPHQRVPSWTAGNDKAVKPALEELDWLRGRIAAMEASTSWRITAPLRGLARTLYRLSAGGRRLTD